MIRRGSAECLAAAMAALAAVACVAPAGAGAGAATITVDTNAGAATDDGNCSLGEAIVASNDDASVDDCHRGNGVDTIKFDIAGSPVIAVAAQLPDVTERATIDGTSEPDFAGEPVVVIDNGGGVATGLETTADRVVIKGLAITDFLAEGVRVDNNRNKIIGNLIGTDSSHSDHGNGTGILVEGAHSKVGGPSPSAANVISGNGIGGGVVAAGPANTVAGNLIGLAPSGSTVLANGTAGVVASGDETLVSDNVISGNAQDGVKISSGGEPGRTRVVGNYIGTDINGQAGLGNGNDGIEIQASNKNVIGGDRPNEGNLISDNLVGVRIGGSGANTVSGNLFGTDAAGVANLGNQSGAVRLFAGAENNTIGGTGKGESNLMRFTPGGAISVGGGDTSFGNSFLRNLAFDNGEEVIDLAENGVTPNDVGPPSDTDDGPNHLQNFPFLFGGDEQTDGIFGTLDSEATTKFRIEFFVSDQPDDAQRFVGAKTIKTGADGHDDFHFKSPNNLPAGDFLTATATRLDGKDLTDTSELSDDADVSVGP